MGSLYVLKIGGSVVTKKATKDLIINKEIIKSAGQEIKQWQIAHPNDKLILIHGAGGPSHHLAKEYSLTKGALNKKIRWQGSILSRIANQSLNLSILKTFVQSGLSVIPIHTGSVIIQNNKSINSFNLKTLSLALKNDHIPLMYGEMVFDTKLGMTICSGDTIASFLTTKFNIKKVFFATDVNGVFDKDPYLHNDAELIKKINFRDIFNRNISIKTSHNEDVTGGLRGKLKSFENISKKNNLKEIVIFNGLTHGSYLTALNNATDNLTKVSVN
jgi:isopentenyl phosphate kinase